MNPADEEWEDLRLAESVRRCAELSASEMLDRAMHDTDAFAAGAEQHDDMTLMVMRLV